MASQEMQSAPFSDGDSDDEFFDALASEESTQNHLANQTSSVEESSSDPTNFQSLENGMSSTLETAKDSGLDEQPESHGYYNESSASLSKTEPNLEEKTCGGMPDDSTDNVKVSNLQGSDTSTADFAVDNAGGDSEQTTFLDASDVPSCQRLSSGDQELTHDGVTCEGVEAEENEGNKLSDEEESKEEEIVVEEMDLRKEREDAMTEQEREKLKEEAQSHKARGNSLFKQNEFLDAISAYSQALEVCPLCYKKERSIMYANRAACRVRREQNEMAIEDCNKALELHPHYLKVWLRRANTYEMMEKLDEALADFKQVLELDPSCYEARAACMRLPDQIKERNEKLKEEMFSKLKDLGNLVLRPFGLSTDNFQMQQDPNTGSYSVNFRQNPTSGNGRP